jgi:hypothetical protein
VVLLRGFVSSWPYHLQALPMFDVIFKLGEPPESVEELPAAAAAAAAAAMEDSPHMEWLRASIGFKAADRGRFGSNGCNGCSDECDGAVGIAEGLYQQLPGVSEEPGCRCSRAVVLCQ